MYMFNKYLVLLHRVPFVYIWDLNVTQKLIFSVSGIGLRQSPGRTPGFLVSFRLSRSFLVGFFFPVFF